MLLKYFYDESIAHASYRVGCQRSGEAIVVDPGRSIVVDPGRSIDRYLEAALAEGLRITGCADKAWQAAGLPHHVEVPATVGA